MPAVEGLGVDAIEVLHSAREIGFRRLDKKVVVIRHQAVGMTDPPEALDDLRKDIEKAGTIRVTKEDVLSRVPAAGDVIECAFVLDAKWTGHDGSIPHPTTKIKI